MIRLQLSEIANALAVRPVAVGNGRDVAVEEAVAGRHHGPQGLADHGVRRHAHDVGRHHAGVGEHRRDVRPHHLRLVGQAQSYGRFP